VDLLQSAQKLRQGVMPAWYQYEVTQFKLERTPPLRREN
jgi:hypothetical protein